MPPQQAQTDPVDHFLALPRDQQEKMYNSLSDPAKKKLYENISARKRATPAQNIARQKLPEQPSTLGKVARGAALGVLEGVGVKPSSTARGVIGGTLSQAAQMVSGPTVEKGTFGERSWQQYEQYAHFPLLFINQLVEGSEQSGRAVREAVKNKDWEAAAEHTASQLTQLLMLKGGKEATEAAPGEGAIVRNIKKIQENGVPPSLTKAATKPVVQRLLYDRAAKVQDHLQAAADSAKAEVGQKWQHLEKTIDTAKPEGSIDISGLQAEAKQAVQETIKSPQKIPATVKEISTPKEAPRVFGEKLDLSNPSHKALYDRLQDEGAIPADKSNITFAEARQLRSKLGREVFGHSTLSGEARAVGVRVYGSLTQAMNKAAAEQNLAGTFADANKLHSEYMDTFVNRKSPVSKALQGNNPHEILGPLSDPKFAEQARRTMAKYQKHGIDPSMVSKEGVLFQKLKSGLPEQLRYSRFELAGDVLGVGLPVTAARLGYNWAKRVGAIRELERPPEFSPGPTIPSGTGAVAESNVEMERRGAQSPADLSTEAAQNQAMKDAMASRTARHNEAVAQAARELGKGASVRDLLKRADEIERGMK